VRFGPRRSKASLAALGSAAAVLLVGLAGCGGSGDSASGPLQAYTSGGGVVASVAGLRLRPGQTADFDAYVVNTSGSPVKVTGVRLVGLPGYRTPQLVHVSAESGSNSIGSQLGWPPEGVALRGDLNGGTVPPGLTRIAVGVRAPARGVFVVSGLSLTYGQGASTVAWGGSVTCAVADPSSPVWCAKHDAGVDGKVRALIHRGRTPGSGT
jgi:hypothetical protein